MASKRKMVFTVTLHEEVADWFRGLVPNRKLSPGIARAQALLLQLGVNSSAESHFRTTSDRPFTQAELDRFEQKAFEQSQAAYREGKPLPDHEELLGKGLGRIRQRVLERCDAAFGWRRGPRPPGIVSAPESPASSPPPPSVQGVILPSVVLPTDNPFDDAVPPRQEAPASPATAPQAIASSAPKRAADAPLIWSYGPTATNQDPGAMWCADCAGLVVSIEGVLTCTGCGRYEEAPAPSSAGPIATAQESSAEAPPGADIGEPTF